MPNLSFFLLHIIFSVYSTVDISSEATALVFKSSWLSRRTSPPSSPPGCSRRRGSPLSRGSGWGQTAVRWCNSLLLQSEYSKHNLDFYLQAFRFDESNCVLHQQAWPVSLFTYLRTNAAFCLLDSSQLTVGLDSLMLQVWIRCCELNNTNTRVQVQRAAPRIKPEYMAVSETRLVGWCPVINTVASCLALQSFPSLLWFLPQPKCMLVIPPVCPRPRPRLWLGAALWLPA